MPDALAVQAGTCHALFAYEVAYAIDLEGAERRLAAATERQTVKQRRRAPASFEYRPAPVRVTLDAEPIALGRFATAPAIEIVLYDFGAVSVSYGIDLAGPFGDLPGLSADLYENERLLADSRRQVERLLATLGEAAIRPGIADLVEDYAIFQVEAFSVRCDPAALWTDHAATVAQILRAEAQALSAQEIHDATASHLSFGADDATFIEPDAALVYDREGDDIRAVIELANTQLLEMRYLDQRLDAALDQAYEMLSRQRGARAALLEWGGSPNVRRLGELQLDSAILFEQVTNALKLIGDQYLARVYGLVSRRFQLAAWDASITRKLQALDSIYGKMMDRAATRRMETLEWIIIVLIAVSIVLGFV
ncbi:MAG TPA: hypothetical protein VNI61_04300 [Gemmatimonadales bacterium]|nr:hypothetical protein [Gemmatimonadales bacterium]